MVCYPDSTEGKPRFLTFATMNLLLLHGALSTRQQLAVLSDVLPAVRTRTLSSAATGSAPFLKRACP